MSRLFLGLTFAVALFAVPAAFADPPVIEPLPAMDFVDMTSCAFPVAVHYTASNETAKFFSDGTIIVSGPIKATFSANGKSVALNVSGPTMIRGESVIGHGVGAGPAQLPDGTTTLAYMTGQIDISGPEGVLIHGHVLLDICAALTP